MEMGSALEGEAASLQGWRNSRNWLAL